MSEPLARYGGLGLAAIAFYAFHAGYYLLVRHEPANVLWACHVASVLIGLGLIVGSPTLNAVGFLWLMVGIPLWVIDLATGGELLATSLFTHVGSPIVGAVGLRRLGLPRGSWAWALVALFALHVLCRFVTPTRANVNLAHAIWPGWEALFPSHLAYVAFGFALSGAIFVVSQLLMRRLGLKEQPA